MSSKYAEIFTLVGRVFSCKFKNKRDKEKNCGYLKEIKVHDPTNSLKWHLEHEHADKEEVQKFLATPKKRPASEQLRFDSKRPSIHCSRN